MTIVKNKKYAPLVISINTQEIDLIVAGLGKLIDELSYSDNVFDLDDLDVAKSMFNDLKPECSY